MQALRLNEVLMRVVAWHNRHPLARRINAAQVHSIGEVVLPFASAQAAPERPAVPALPVLHELLDPPASLLDSQADGPPARADADADAAQAQPGLAAEPAHPGPSPDSPGKHPLDAPVEAGGNGPANAADMPDAGPAQDEAATEPAPVLSMEDEADTLFSGDAAASADAPGSAAATDHAPLDDDGPEMLIELSSDADELADPAFKVSPDLASDPTPDAPATDPATPLTASEADSAELAAAFAAATADAPLPASGADAIHEHSPAPEAPALAGDPAQAGLATLAANPPAEPDAEAPASHATPPDHPHPAALAAGSASPAQAVATTTASSGAPATAATAATAASKTGLARLRAWLQGLRRPGSGAQGLPRLQATFSRDFIWPLRPAQVARWARRHGSLQTLAPPDWPQRLIDTDASLQTQARSQGLQHALPLHVLTAAIGVGDRRIRVLIDANGHVLGPRSYSPPKLASLASVVAVGLLGTGWAWLPRADSLSQQQASAAVAAAASAAAQAASAAELAAAAASAAESMWRAQQAGSSLASTAAADGPEGHGLHTAQPADSQPDDGAAAPAPHGAAATASAHDTVPANADAAAAAAAASITSPTETPAATAPEATTTATASAMPALGAILPVLSPATKLAARQQAQALRSDKAAADAAVPPPAPATVYAIVTHPTREKQSAARSLALIRASGNRLGGDAPEHGELMSNQGEWRAAWWPFESQADAERARIMLAARGVKAEVVEF